MDSSCDSDSSVEILPEIISPEPSKIELKKLIDEFNEVTDEPTLAYKFLQERNWDVVSAINGYFKFTRKQSRLEKLQNKTHSSDVHDIDSDSSEEILPESIRPEPSEAEFKKLIDEFNEVTGEPTLAKKFLRENNWNIVRAINGYFRFIRKKENKRKTTSNEHNHLVIDLDSENELTPSKKQKHDFDQPSSSKSPIKKLSETSPTESILFRHLTWNIDGINERNLLLRTNAICNAIIKEKVFFAFLQEVTDECEKIIQHRLSDKFIIFTGNDNVLGGAPYFTMTLVNKDEHINVESNRIIPFKNTIMARNLLEIMVTYHGVKICFINTHLESTKDGTNFRIQQLNFLLKHFGKIDPSYTIIAGGDLNLRDKELANLGGLPPQVVDAWITTGKRKEVEFTWDMTRNTNLSNTNFGKFKPRMRFDRIFIRKSCPERVGIVHFGLTGIERLKPNVCFPSDHWGVITSYQLFGK